MHEHHAVTQRADDRRALRRVEAAHPDGLAAIDRDELEAAHREAARVADARRAELEHTDPHRIAAEARAAMIADELERRPNR